MGVIKLSKKATVGTAVLSSVSLKVCCWGPLLLTSVAGVSGSSAYFSWLSALKPYLLTIAFLSLGFAFYQVYKPKKKETCPANCKTEKISFFRSKLYVWFVAVFVVFMTSVSFYPQLFHQTTNKTVVIVDKSDVQSVNLKIEGMTCAGCEENINQSVNQLNGILRIRTSYKTGTAEIDFNKRKTDLAEIVNAIKSKGYAVAVKNE
ncbi:MAG TPA: mercuric transport protein MerTP [Bacteroidetes bacterium]|nr:mercuric transport protein MerTP [Bacteroidota bacterium]